MLRTVLKLLLGLLFRVRVLGPADALSRGRPLVLANHDSLLDALLVALFLPGKPLIVLPRVLAGHRIGRLVRRCAECVEPDDSGAATVKRLLRAVRGGRPVVMFPQDRVTTTGTTMKVYGVAGVIALRSGADVIPLRIQGTLHTRWAATGPRWPRQRVPRVTLRVLPAQPFAAPVAVGKGTRRQRINDQLQGLMQQAMVAAEPRRSLFGALLEASALHGRRTRIFEDVRSQITRYGDLLKGAFALGRLTAGFTESGERVGVLLPNIGATVCLVFGLVSRGRVAAMLNYSSGAESVRGACAAATIRTVITSRSFVEVARLQPLLEALSSCRIVYLEDLRGNMRLADKLWILRALLHPASALPETDPAATAVVLFTSGSEARPKGVALSQEGMLASMAQLRAVIDFGPDDKYLNALPMYHIFGLVVGTLMPLLTGTRLFLYTNPLHYKVIPEYAYTRDCTYVFGTSTFLGNYARQAHPYDFYRMRFVISGGEKLHPEVAQLWFSKFGLRVHEGYGATECGPAMAFNAPLGYRAGTVGRFLPGIEYRVVPVPGIEQGGVVHVRGPNLMQGYFFHDRPGVLEPPRSEVGEGWYNTGDVVSVDADGFVTVLGRVKRFAKIAGEMVSLERVETIAYHASPAFKHAAVVEMTRSGESTVLLTTDPELDRIALHHAAREINAQELAVARRVVKVDNLPLLGSGKIDYVTLKEMVVL
ncbi:MAG: AMP-binding protein [Burkholderiales bacterium]|jgi:acyl-[acyl-carrier-protein]-phospholipid O-acyltransferase/long-chain-fatty-acid--[acyl-carrier-protein] ligase|nr:AMP-binding protein [Burkholderiales bacterium]